MTENARMSDRVNNQVHAPLLNKHGVILLHFVTVVSPEMVRRLLNKVCDKKELSKLL
jgi:hypothetical protein